MWKGILALACGMLAFAQGPGPVPAESKVMAAPALPYLDWNACPFEGCIYREWTARKSIVVYDTWNSKRKKVAAVGAGDRVTGVSGVVITSRPGKIRMDRDLPEEGLHRGDTILTYTYLGEGLSSVWFKGRFYPEFDITFARSDGPRCSDSSCSASYIDMGVKTWWAEVKLPSGRIGWVNMNQADFDGIDQLASVLPSLAVLRRQNHPATE